MAAHIAVQMVQTPISDIKGVPNGDALLQRHFPRYYFDADEVFFPLDLNRYVADKTEIAGCNGAVVKSESGMTWLIYMNFYLEDGGLRLCGCQSTCCTAGDHAYDLEVVVVELDSVGAITGVLYGPHSSYEHFWIRDPDDLTEILGGEGGEGLHPRVYISRGKHASYPISGTIYRIFGFANDICNDPVGSTTSLVALNQAAMETELIDGVYAGPATKLARDWSVAPFAGLSSVRLRRLIPPFAQIMSELADLCCCCCE